MRFSLKLRHYIYIYKYIIHAFLLQSGSFFLRKVGPLMCERYRERIAVCQFFFPVYFLSSNFFVLFFEYTPTPRRYLTFPPFISVLLTDFIFYGRFSSFFWQRVRIFEGSTFDFFPFHFMYGIKQKKKEKTRVIFFIWRRELAEKSSFFRFLLFFYSYAFLLLKISWLATESSSSVVLARCLLG